MKAFRPFLLCTLLIAGMLSGMAQVKQIFKVTDAVSGKSLAGAKLVLYGQPLQTNAKGVAVAVLPAELKGGFLAQDLWELDGYICLNSLGGYFDKELQSNDTIFAYMVEEGLYKKEISDIFVNLFNEDMIWLKDKISHIYDSVKTDLEARKKFGQSLFDEVSGSRNQTCDMFVSDALDIVNILHRDNQMPADIANTLRQGKVDEAVELALQQIKSDDVTPENLTRIARYLELRSLYASTEDTLSTTNFYKILYEQHFGENSAQDYLRSLLNKEQYEEAKAFIAKEKDNNTHHDFDALFTDPPFQYYETDNNKFLEAARNYINAYKQSNQQYPAKYMQRLIEQSYISSYYANCLLEDTLGASADMDSMLLYCRNYLADYRQGDFKNDVIDVYHRSYLISYITNYIVRMRTDSILALSSQIYQDAKRLYLSDTSNLMGKILFAVKGEYCRHLTMQIDEEKEIISQIEREIQPVIRSLETYYPYYFALEDIEISSSVITRSATKEEDESIIRNDFKSYKSSFYAINKLFPNQYLDNFLTLNANLEAYFASEGKSTLNNALADFNEELLRMKAADLNEPIENTKAAHYNRIAEKLYKWEDFDKSYPYYQQSLDLYKIAINKDHKYWTNYLGTYLQMGDAYLYAEEYDKAIATYRKILDEEPNIPADVMPQYLTQKGSVYWFEGDVYRSQKNLSAAEKSYKTAEKWLKKAIAAGDNEAYRCMGEMYFTKGIISYQQNNIKKAYQLLDQSEKYYGAYNFKNPSERYETLLNIMEEYYEEKDDALQYIKVQTEKAAYNKLFLDYGVDYMSDHAEALRKLSILSKGTEQELPYREEYMEALKELCKYRDDLSSPYIQGCYGIAEAYRLSDSTAKAIKYYEECLSMNDAAYKDTAYARWEKNCVDVYMPLAAAYEEMADVDTSNSQRWYGKAMETRDTLTTIMARWCAEKPDDIDQAYRLSFQYYKAAITYAEADLPYMGLERLDKSDAILLEIYKGEYRSAIEEDLVRNYWLRGAIYDQEDDMDKAKELYNNAIKCADNAIDTKSVASWAVVSISSLIELLEDDPTADPNEIKALKQKLANYAKYIDK